MWFDMYPGSLSLSLSPFSLECMCKIIAHEYAKEMESVVRNCCALSLPLIFMTVQSFVYMCIVKSEKERESLERGERFLLVHIHVFLPSPESQGGGDKRSK